jgi:NIMA (never in mitosis gene a)-related kinase
MASFRPPFVSSDLRNLKKVIVNGVYKKIPPMYSPSLEKLIKMCLHVNQKERPSADDLLNCSEFRKYFEDPVFGASRCSSVQLIEKIRAPKKREFRIIKERLPKSRFSSEKSLGNS